MNERLEDAYRVLRRAYVAESAERIGGLRTDAAALRDGAPEAAAALRVRFHRLAGSAGSYGFAEASRLAREAEQWLAEEPPATAETAARVDAAIDDIERVFAREDAAPGPA